MVIRKTPAEIINFIEVNEVNAFVVKFINDEDAETTSIYIDADTCIQKIEYQRFSVDMEEESIFHLISAEIINMSFDDVLNDVIKDMNTQEGKYLMYKRFYGSATCKT